MDNICINCKHCVFKYDMYLCVKDNMPEPTSTESTCNDFKKKGISHLDDNL